MLVDGFQVTFGSGVSGGGRCPRLEKRTSSTSDLLALTRDSPEKRADSMLLRKGMFGETKLKVVGGKSYMSGV